MAGAQQKLRGTTTTEQPPPDLIQIYSVIVEEYRFQVRFNWERLRYCLGLSLGLSGAAFGLLHVRDGWVLSMAALVAFLVGGAIAWLGIRVTHKGREYYRQIRATKANVEQALALRSVQIGSERLNLAIESTEGMRERGRGVEPQTLIRASSITSRFVQVFWLIILVNAVGGIACIGSIAMG